LARAFDTLTTDAILALPREQLLLRIYEVLLLRIREAEEGLESGARARAGLAISSAFEIVAALREALDPTVGAHCVSKLDQLYRTVGSWLLEANLTRSQELLRSSRKVLSTLKEGWDGAVSAK
jgi:flagellin-specific chaperone FliS